MADQYFPGSGSANYELRLYEGQTRFDMIYGTVTNGNTSATAGVQKNDTTFDQYFCNGSGGAATGGQSYILQSCGTPRQLRQRARAKPPLQQLLQPQHRRLAYGDGHTDSHRKRTPTATAYGYSDARPILRRGEAGTPRPRPTPPPRPVRFHQALSGDCLFGNSRDLTSSHDAVVTLTSRNPHVEARATTR